MSVLESPLPSRPFESPMTLAVRNSRATVATNPSLVAAGADIAEADAAQRVAADPSVIDAERDALYAHGVDHASDLGRPGDAAQGDPQSSVRPGTAEYCKCGYSHEDYCGGELCKQGYEYGAVVAAVKAADRYEETARRARLSRWQEQRG